MERTAIALHALTGALLGLIAFRCLPLMVWTVATLAEATR